MFQTLSRIGKALTEAGVGWAVGASVLLNRYNLAENPNDLDLLVCVEGAEKAAGLLAAMGETIPCVQSATYATRFFRKFRIDGTDVDMMAGFAINHPEGRYEYVFDDVSVASLEEMECAPVPFAALEDWYVVYQLIPGKEYKAVRIEEYLLRCGIGHPYLLERALSGCLPDCVRMRIEALLARQG